MRAYLLALLAVPVQANESCFGTAPKYDSQCAGITSEQSCDAQFVCEWGDKTKDHCFAKDGGNPDLKKHCYSLTSEKDCNVQIGCEWRSVEALEAWIGSVSSAVKGLAMAKPAVPSTVRQGMGSPHAAHDHQQMDVGQLSNVLDAWKTKYGLPDQAVSAMKSLVVVEASDFKNSHTLIRNGEGSLSELAIGGRNYNGQISLAFVFGGVSSNLAKKANSVSCSDHDCTRHQRQQECDCQVDGRYIPHGYGSGCHDGKYDDCPARYGWTSTRALTAAESDAVQKNMQNAMFAKVNAEGVLLENELRNGVSSVVV